MAGKFEKKTLPDPQSPLTEQEYKQVSEVTPQKPAPQKVKAVKKGPVELLIRDILDLLIKIVAIAAIGVCLFTFVFGIYRSTEPSMAPAVKDGDLVIYFRTDKEYAASDVVVLEFEGKIRCLRVVATAGDTVDFKDTFLYVNGSLQQEKWIHEETLRYDSGVDFPLTVQEGQVFVLGDSRENATDSRIFGPVEIADTHGKVITLIRRRNI